MSSIVFIKQAAMQSTLPQQGCQPVSGVHTSYFMYFIYWDAGESVAQPGRKEANVSVRIVRISFGALP
jgi:hypothetical protein